MGITRENHQIDQGEIDILDRTAEQLQLQLPIKVVVPITNEEAECLKELRKRIKGDDKLRDCGVDQDEEFLLAFVRGKKCNPEKAFTVLQNYVQVRKVKYPDFFQNLNPLNFKYLLDFPIEQRFCGVLKGRDNLGRVVGIGQSSLFNPRVHKVDDVIQSYVAMGTEILRTESGPRNGLVLVVDASGFGFRHAREFTMSRIYMFLQVFLGAYPIKYKGFHILNNAYIFDTILTLVKQLIPKKLRDRIHLHGKNYESLHKHVPREILPKSFGGLLEEADCYDYEMERSMINKRDYF